MKPKFINQVAVEKRARKTERNRARRKRQALARKKGDALTPSKRTTAHAIAVARHERIKGKKLRRFKDGSLRYA